ncbi:MAG: hypothetical protein QOJ99_4814 [Bryobacterales bacterium]|nr:hypothetical protein [Bryobacterales bacterium]
MIRTNFVLLLLACAACASAAPSTTFHKDVEPLLQAHCQTCHRPGEIGPMPLLTYQQTRQWSAAIKEAVMLKKMPPWFADASAHQRYKEDLSLSNLEMETIRKWVDAGSPEGDPKDAPKPRTFLEGWNIGKPDLIVSMPEAYRIPATGTVEYTYLIIPSGFKEDTWVKAAEIRPGNRAAMHHAILFARTPGSKWLAEYPPGVPFVPAARPGSKHRSSDGDRTIEGSLADEWIVGYVPGRRPEPLPDDTAFLVKAGSDFVLQIHYTPNGKESTDLTKVGLVLSRQPPAHRAFIAGVVNNKFSIPPGAPDYKVNGSLTMASDAKVLAAGPHMHLRGKSMLMRVTYPTGESEVLFDVPRYDFNWQQMYAFASPTSLSKGTKIEITAAYDNSPNNPHNPDPTATVEWGDQSWNEMALGTFTLQIDRDADLDALFQKPAKKPRDVAAN